MFSRRLVLTGAAALALFYQLMLPPVPGVADNGDFGKLLGRYGLASGQTFIYANTKLHVADQYRYRSGFYSSESLLIAPAVVINRVLSPDGSFDLRIMGAVHGLLFLLAVFLFASVVKNTAIGALAILLFGDFLYAGFLNSFYMDAAAYLFTLLAAVFYLRAILCRRTIDSLALLAAMLLVITSKSQFAMLGPWFAGLFWLSRDWLAAGRKAVAAAACALLLAATWISYRYFAPQHYAAANPFSVIFSQILPNAPNPDRALLELGLDDRYRRWIGLQAYSPGVPLDDPDFFADFRRRTSYRKIALYYLRHPTEAWQALRTSLDVSGRFQSPLGNFDSHSGKPPAAQYQSFQFISRCKRRVFHHHGGRLFMYFAALAILTPAVVWRRMRRQPGAVWGAAVLAAMALSSLVFSALADVYDQLRHELIPFALFDILALVLVWSLLFRRAAKAAIRAQT
jgi:hypothetical protein